MTTATTLESEPMAVRKEDKEWEWVRKMVSSWVILGGRRVGSTGGRKVEEMEEGRVAKKVV